MRRWENTGRRAARRVMGLAMMLLLAGGVAACGDDDDITDVVLTDLELVEGIYEVQTITFDPSGSAPAADVLLALEEGGIAPELNVGKTGSFQLVYRDPATGNFITVSGTVEPTEDGVELVFGSQGAADQFVFPRIVPLQFDEEEETLSFSGEADVNRERLQELFPELYGEEPWTSETIPGFLTMSFLKT